MKLRTQILLTFLIVIKLVLGSVFMYRIGLGPLFSDAKAIAAEQAKDTEVSAKKDEKKPKEETIDLKYLIMHHWIINITRCSQYMLTQ